MSGGAAGKTGDMKLGPPTVRLGLRYRGGGVAIADAVAPRRVFAQAGGLPSLAPTLRKITPAVVEIEIRVSLPPNPAPSGAARYANPGYRVWRSV